MRYKRSSNEKGFTLIELMVVLVIVGILTGLLIPNISGFVAQQEINEAAQNVAGALRSAKEIAITKNVSTVVEIDDNTRTYVIYRQPMPGENLPGPTSSFPGVITGDNFVPIETKSIITKGNIGLQTKASKNPSGGSPVANPYIAIGFTSRGTAGIGNGTDAGTIYLMPDKEFAQNKKEKMRAITVSAATGRARIYTWNSGLATANKWE